MSSTPLQILQKLTKPKSAEETRAFLIERHGLTVRDNASSDISALDEVALKALSPGAVPALGKLPLTASLDKAGAIDSGTSS